MARVNTNNFGLRYVIESSLGVAPTSGWRSLEPNNVTDFGSTITTVARRPISADRARRKGTVVNLESSVAFEADITMDSFVDFAEGFVFSEFANVEFDLTSPKMKGSALNTDTTADTFEFGAQLSTFTNGTVLAGKLTYSGSGAISLLFASGYANSANNGFHPISAVPTGTDTGIGVATNLVTETAPANASVQVAGVRVTDADLTLTVSGSTATLVSAADISNWATLGLRVGQYIHIGSGTTTVQNALSASTADDTYGYARITAISGATLSLDKLDTNLAATADNDGTGVADILFGRFLRNVPVGSDSNDTRYIERSYTFEGSYPDLGGVGTPEYEYPAGNLGNELTLNLPLTEKATATWGFIGTTTPEITASRKTGPSTAVSPLRTDAVGTAQDIASISTDVVSSASDVCFKSLEITFNNNVSPENCLGVLGASFVNTDLFEVNISGQMLFTNKEIVNAIRNNTTVTFAAILKNGNGAVAVDVPSMTLGGGGREFPVGESVLVNITGEAFNDPQGTIPDVSIWD
jgi:hypothetical protein